MSARHRDPVTARALARLREITADPLEDPDPARAGEAAAVEVLLRCYVRETGTAVPGTGGLLRLHPAGLTLTAPVLYRSPSGWHRFGLPRLADGSVADLPLVAAALVREGTARLGLPAHAGTAAVGRILDSARRIGIHLARRRAVPDPPPGTSPFLDAEQDLLLGHPFHPVAKARQGASEEDLEAWSPELRGCFPLRWFAVHRSLLAGESALPRPAGDLLAPLAGGLRLPPGTVAVPAHPWQARRVLAQPAMGALLEAGLVHDLGPAGPPWYPTSSVRTVYRPDAELMLKLSLGLRITNSCRNNLRSELTLGVRAARLLGAGLAASLRRAHPRFAIVADPAWISVDVPGAPGPESGLETAIRTNPFGPTDRVACVAGLIAERPGLGPSRLGVVLHGLARRTGRQLGQVTEAWFARYLHVLAVPLLWLDAAHGVGVEAHQQNTLVGLDAHGWPESGWYRDSQGYYLRASRAEAVRDLLPGFDDQLPVVFDDAFVDERIGYYLGVNNLLGLIGALGAQRLADEAVLLARLRRTLQGLAGGRYRVASTVARLLLEAPTLRCKANHLTSVDGRDELVGPVETQSVYIDMPNPIAQPRP